MARSPYPCPYPRSFPRPVLWPGVRNNSASSSHLPLSLYAGISLYLVLLLPIALAWWQSPVHLDPRFAIPPSVHRGFWIAALPRTVAFPYPGVASFVWNPGFRSGMINESIREIVTCWFSFVSAKGWNFSEFTATFITRRRLFVLPSPSSSVSTGGWTHAAWKAQNKVSNAMNSGWPISFLPRSKTRGGWSINWALSFSKAAYTGIRCKPMLFFPFLPPRTVAFFVGYNPIGLKLVFLPKCYWLR